MCNLLNIASINIHRIKIDVTISRGSENDLVAFRTHSSFGIISWFVREFPPDISFEICHVNIERVIDGPDVFVIRPGFRFRRPSPIYRAGAARQSCKWHRSRPITRLDQ